MPRERSEAGWRHRPAASPIGRGLCALANAVSLGAKGEGMRPHPMSHNPSPPDRVGGRLFRPKRLDRFAACDAKAESHLPMGEAAFLPLTVRN